MRGGRSMLGDQTPALRDLTDYQILTRIRALWEKDPTLEVRACGYGYAIVNSPRLCAMVGLDYLNIMQRDEIIAVLAASEELARPSYWSMGKVREKM